MKLTLVQVAGEREELTGAFESFRWNADKHYPGWCDRLFVKIAQALLPQ